MSAITSQLMLMSDANLIELEDPDPLPQVDDTLPVYKEAYGDETREQYTQTRVDLMHFRILDDKSNETRLFRQGRSDDVRECTVNLKQERRVKKIVFGGKRKDRCLEYSRTCSSKALPDNEQTFGEPTRFSHMLSHELKFDSDRPDGIQRIVLQLRPDTQVDAAVDTATLLFREKCWHVAVVTDHTREEWSNICESYYEMEGRNLRLVIVDPSKVNEEGDDHLKTQKHFNCLLPNNDEHYERGRVVIMTAVAAFLEVERELFFTLPDFEYGKSVAEVNQIQNARLESAMKRMAQQLDELTSRSAEGENAAWPSPVVTGSPKRVRD